MKTTNEVLKEDLKITRAAMIVVISASLIVYATGILHALYTHTYFMVKLFTIEAVLAIAVVYIATKMFRH